MIKILVGVPSYDRRIDIDLMKIFLKVERLQKYHLDFLFPVSSHLCRNRNICCHAALKENYDYLLFIDSDTGINDETFIDKMLDTAYKFDAKVVGGAYRMKKPDMSVTYIAGKRTEEGKYENLHGKLTKPQLVNSVGTGIMLINNLVLRKLEDPWFTIIDKPNGDVMPEDFEFCRKVENKGFKIALDPRFTTHHYGPIAWTHDVNKI